MPLSTNDPAPAMPSTLFDTAPDPRQAPLPHPTRHKSPARPVYFDSTCDDDARVRQGAPRRGSAARVLPDDISSSPSSGPCLSAKHTQPASDAHGGGDSVIIQSSPILEHRPLDFAHPFAPRSSLDDLEPEWAYPFLPQPFSSFFSQPDGASSDAADDQVSSYSYCYPFPPSDAANCMSPESISTDADTDIDDESLASSLSSLSPSITDQDSVFAPFLFEECSSRHLTDNNLHETIYHFEDEYPIYPQHTRSSGPSTGSESPNSPSSIPLFSSPSPPPSDSIFFDCDIPIPCSPYRRLSDLPWADLSDEPSSCLGLSTDTQGSADDSHTLYSFRSPRRSSFLSLPGAETDDDLIPAALASKNYLPDPCPPFGVDDTKAKNAAPPSSPLLLLFDNIDVPTAFSPPPETLSLPSNLLLEYGEDDDVHRLFALRERLLKPSYVDKNDPKARFDRQRCREASALLRLKLKLEPSATTTTTAAKPPPAPSISDVPVDNGLSSAEGVRPGTWSGQSSSSSSSSYPKVTNMPQLVASMVLNRRQDASRRRLGGSTTGMSGASGASMGVGGGGGGMGTSGSGRMVHGSSPLKTEVC